LYFIISKSFFVVEDSSGNNQDKIHADEFELIQLAMIHLSSSNREFLYVIVYFLTQCVRNKQFCSNETSKLRVSTMSFSFVSKSFDVLLLF